MQNIIIPAAAEAVNIAETYPDINGTTMSLIIAACALLIAVAIVTYIHYCK